MRKMAPWEGRQMGRGPRAPAGGEANPPSRSSPGAPPNAAVVTTAESRGLNPRRVPARSRSSRDVKPWVQIHSSALRGGQAGRRLL